MSGAIDLTGDGGVLKEIVRRDKPDAISPSDDLPVVDGTPIENVKRVAMEENHIHGVAERDDSDEETQDMNPKPSPSRQRIQVAETSKKGFKHVELVRKKAEKRIVL